LKLDINAYHLHVFGQWGEHGQTGLESAHVCLINATGTGTEILKSLLLPGVGAFTIVDGKKVTEEDTGFKLVKAFVRNSDLISHRHNYSMF